MTCPVPRPRRFASLILLAVCACAYAGAAETQGVNLDCTPDTFPALTIAGDAASTYPNGQPAGFRGFADPCIRKDPASEDLWMVYSWPHMQHLGGGKQDFTVGVETHLAKSRDQGKTWQYLQTLWPRTPVTWTDGKTGRTSAGFLSHEVPNIVPCVVDHKPMWAGVRLDYFLARKGNYKARDNLSFCLRVMAAPTLPALKDASYVTFGHQMSSADCRVDVNVCSLSRDFPPVFIPNEPALHFRDGRLYLAFVAMTFWGPRPDFAKSFIAVFSTTPTGDPKGWSWRYHGKLAGRQEAQELGGESLTQIELAHARDGKLLALLTPEAWDLEAAKRSGSSDAFYGIKHYGCAVLEVASLEKPALARNPDGTLLKRAWIHSSAQSDNGPGAAAYDPASATGILFTLREFGADSLSWTLHPTRLHP